MMGKNELRSYVRNMKKQHQPGELAAMSAAICGSISHDGRYQGADTLLLYHPLPDEVDVRPLIDEAYQLGKKVLLPVVVGDDLELRIYRPDAMAEGAFGIQEPTGELFADYDDIRLAIIPGMGFDAQNHRLGRGKGYYDRLLPRLRNAVRMGVCFGFQYLDQVPSEPHDVLMDIVIKE
ncbi:MAG: 5-formyltetrahydrofolate cyclo-ligase [Bacteroidales bacterium]|nr:5-formyltetrahydrofolate cyclo-ligase [Bacteroidales bacterium]